MDQNSNSQYKQAQQQQQQQAYKQQPSVKHQLQCPNCGAAYAEGDAFCCECGERLNERHCPFCGSAVSASCEICPKCGKPIDGSHCSFCGAAFEGEEPFCAECGSPRAGIPCPNCGTLGFRSFCGRCNTPLNDNAAMALEQARRDPQFQQAQKLADEMAQMEAYLLEMQQEIEEAIIEAEAEGDAPDIPTLTQEGREVQARIAEMLKNIGKAPAQPATPRPAKPKPKRSVEHKQELQIKFAEARNIMDSYNAKANEMNAIMQQMLPDANMTPAQQRDYACARKVKVETTKVKEINQYWVCNFCGCYHYQPSECCEPWLGGTWIKQKIVVTDRAWKYLD